MLPYLFTLITLVLLGAGEVLIAYRSGEGPNPSEGIILYIVITIGPLTLIALSLVLSLFLSISTVVIAWIAIIIGGFIQFSYHTGYGSSNTLFMPISMLTYWVCAYLALVRSITSKFEQKRHPLIGTQKCPLVSVRNYHCNTKKLQRIRQQVTEILAAG